MNEVNSIYLTTFDLQRLSHFQKISHLITGHIHFPFVEELKKKI